MVEAADSTVAGCSSSQDMCLGAVVLIGAGAVVAAVLEAALD